MVEKSQVRFIDVSLWRSRDLVLEKSLFQVPDLMPVFFTPLNTPAIAQQYILETPLFKQLFLIELTFND